MTAIGLGLACAVVLAVVVVRAAATTFLTMSESWLAQQRAREEEE